MSAKMFLYLVNCPSEKWTNWVAFLNDLMKFNPRVILSNVHQIRIKADDNNDREVASIFNILFQKMKEKFELKHDLVSLLTSSLKTLQEDDTLYKLFKETVKNEERNYFASSQEEWIREFGNRISFDKRKYFHWLWHLSQQKIAIFWTHWSQNAHFT